MGTIQIPRYYAPRPYQREAWARRLSGKYTYMFDCWHRQSGKDTDYIQYSLYDAYGHPGIQAAYVGIDNKWIRRNIWDKYIDGRRHWQDYPSDVIDPHETNQQVKMLNNPKDLASALIQFIGFKESQSLIGSSYDRFYISELSLYKRNAYDFIQPIWDNKESHSENFAVNFNFTPRGMSNIAADMLRAYTGEDDPADWPGAHGNVYVNIMPADQTTDDDGNRLFTDEQLDKIRARYVRAMGNDLLFRQEYMCEFLAANAGLVFPNVELIRKEHRYTPYNIDKSKPVYMAWDISSKDKVTDWTSCVVFQYYNDRLFICDWYENNRKAVVECVQDVAERDYFHLIRAACLPWDADRSGSQQSPYEECWRTFPNIAWHKLERTYVTDGINRARTLLGNAIVNSNKCDWFMECLENWEYKQLSSVEDWAATPKHDRYSHLMDALRYAADFIMQVPYIRTADGRPKLMPESYEAWNLGDAEGIDREDLPPGMRPSKLSKRKQKRDDEYGPWF